MQGDAGVAELEVRVADGGARADFEAYVAARYGALLGLAYLLTQDRALAEDLVQATLTKCWLAWRKVQADDPTAYVRRVMVNTHTEWWRRRRGGKEVPTDDLSAVAPAAYGAGSVRLVEHSDLMQALRRLPKKMCAAVVLRYFEDLSEAETADVLGCSIGTVKSQTHRALSKLRVDLDSQATTETR